MSKKYPQKTPIKTEREVFISILDCLLKEFDRMQKHVDDATKKIEEITKDTK